MVRQEQLILFRSEKRPYRIRARNERYAICTKPFNLRPHTVLYTIVDFVEQVRGPENLIFGLGAETDLQCQEMLQRLICGESAVSRRHRIPLDLEGTPEKK